MAYGIKLHCWGDFALFTRPEMKVERVSYDVMTPSAARGIVEAIYWKPQIRWVIDRLRVLRPIRFTSQRRNEVAAKISEASARKAMKSGSGNLGLYVEEERQQRAAMLLRNVAYVIEAHFEILAGEENEAKHLDQFNRRARTGQCFTRPYFGTRECVADFELLENGAEPKDTLPFDQRNRDLGWMLHDIDRSNGRQQPRFFHATIEDGLIHVPPLAAPEVRG
jgi:CRISPR-associated protein Cas5d